MMEKTFADLCPQWNKHLDEKFENILSKYNENGHILDMENFGCCLMGEAWNFQYNYMDQLSDGKYLCDKCKKIAQDFGNIFYALSNSLRYNPDKEIFEKAKKILEKDFEKTKITFVKHLNTCKIFKKFQELESKQ